MPTAQPEIVERSPSRRIRTVDRYDAIADELFDPDVCRAVALQNRYCDLLLERLWCALELATLLAQPRTSSELAEQLGFVPSADTALSAMLGRLARRVGVVRMIDGT
ncbi:MAG TPA: hypothetical protein VFG69_07015, partial [Nannocystaceae bacterium]|nr:hypothetical protein [Nannocystaceae bacterium]